MNEIIWKPISGWEGLYSISNKGDIRSEARVVPHSRTGTRTIPERIMKLDKNNKGYKYVNLYFKNKCTRRKVHVLVAENFIPNPEGLPWVLHYDDDQNNNNVENLRWGTPSDNNFDRVRTGGHYNANKNTCPQGHLLIEPNLIPSLLKNNARGCLACNKARTFMRNKGYTENFKEISDIYYKEIINE